MSVIHGGYRIGWRWVAPLGAREYGLISDLASVPTGSRRIGHDVVDKHGTLISI